MITIRQSCIEDLHAFSAVLEACGMGVDISVDYCLVAVEEKSPVGLARLEFGEGIPYVRPVVVLPVRQGKGIGTRLLRIVIATYQEVRVVSRGPSTEFYRKLGFERMAWGDIHQPFRQECEQCPDRSECNPCPMVYRAIADEIG